MKELITSNFKQWNEKALAKVQKKQTELKQTIKPKQTTPLLGDPDVKKHLPRFIENLLLSPFIKHQIVLHLYVENTTFPKN